MITNEKLKKCINNKNAMEIVSKVLNYNFKDENKTKALINITKKYIMEDTTSLSDVHNYVKGNNLQITDDNESERVSRKVNDLTDLLNKNITGKDRIQSVLDIGVGNGNILTAFGKEIGLSKKYLYGVDTVDYTENTGFNHLIYENGSIPKKNNSIDLITIMMVLHHTENPIETLKEAYRVLAKDGSLIIRETNAYNDDILEFNIIMEYIFYTILLNIPVNITENYLSLSKWEKLFTQVGFSFEKAVENELKNDPFTSVYYILRK